MDSSHFALKQRRVNCDKSRKPSAPEVVVAGEAISDPEMAAAASAGGSGAGAKAPNPMTASLGSGTASVNISSFGFLMFAVAKYFDSRKGGPTTMQAK